MNAKQIVINWLQLNGKDGLCTASCGCGLDDLVCCGGDFSECAPAKRYECKPDPDTCGDCMIYSDGPADACYRPSTTEAEQEETHL